MGTRIATRDHKDKVLSVSVVAGDIGSELWLCRFAPCGYRRGPQRLYRDTDRQQLRFLVRRGRLHHSCRHRVRLRYPKARRGDATASARAASMVRGPG